MFGSITKKEHDIAIFESYKKGYNAAKDDIECLLHNTEVLIKALELIASDQDNKEDLVDSMKNIAATALHWYRLNTPKAYRMTEPDEQQPPPADADTE
jgi:hypothetical protein